MADEIEIHRRIIRGMHEGVVTFDLEGRITTFNPAAGRLLGIDPQGALGCTFAEVFFAEGFPDDFNDLVLDAIYGTVTTDWSEIRVETGGEARNLLVSTTVLTDGDGADERKIGVIVVFSDVSERQKRKRLKQLFGRYVDPRIVEMLIDHGGDSRGRRSEMSVLFCDLQGFTGLSEHLGAEKVIELVNLYLGLMSQPVLEAGGIIDKYIGDAIMAFWGPPFHDPGEHAARACRAALGQRARLGELRAQVQERLGLDPVLTAGIDLRVGVATGEVVLGTVGTEIASNFTVLGDTVNLAARLEAANKSTGTRVLISDQTAQLAGGEFQLREIGKVSLPGRKQQEVAFELLEL